MMHLSMILNPDTCMYDAYLCSSTLDSDACMYDGGSPGRDGATAAVAGHEQAYYEVGIAATNGKQLVEPKSLEC